MAVDLIGTINVNPQTIDFVQIEDCNAETFQLFRGGIRAGYRALDLPFHRTERINKVCGGRASPYTNNSAGLYVLESGPSYCFFQFILRHDLLPVV
ncbi:hypothetical protein D3C76_1201630 [compost metagenome]